MDELAQKVEQRVGSLETRTNENNKRMKENMVESIEAMFDKNERTVFETFSQIR